MSEVLEFFRKQEPRFADVSDEELTSFIGKEFPQFLEDQTFSKRFSLVQEKTGIAAEQAKADQPVIPIRGPLAIRKGDIAQLGEAATEPFFPIPKPEATPDDPLARQIRVGLERAGIGLAEAIESPLGVSLVAASALPGGVGKAIGTAGALTFGSKALLEGFRGIVDRAKAGDVTGASEAFGNLLIGAGMLGAGAATALKSRPTAFGPGNLIPLTEAARKQVAKDTGVSEEPIKIEPQKQELPAPAKALEASERQVIEIEAQKAQEEAQIEAAQQTPPVVSPQPEVSPTGQAAVATARTVNDFLAGEQQVFGAISQPFTPKALLQDLPNPKQELGSLDRRVESRWQDARIVPKTILQKAKEAMQRTKIAFTRHFEHLDPKTDGASIEILRQHQEVPSTAQAMAAQVIRGITAGLGPKKYDVFSRLTILPDLLKDIDRGLYKAKEVEPGVYEAGELPFGYADRAAVEADLAKFQTIANQSPDIAQAVAKRQEFMHILRDDLVARELLPKEVQDFDQYFHHQVLEYYAMREMVTPGTSAKDVRTHGKGWQKGRIGSAKDFNTSYLESEFEVVSQALAQMATQDTLSRLRNVNDIKPDLIAAAKEAGIDWHTLIPKDHEIWQPKPGNHFYWANTITDKALDSYLRGLKQLTEEDISKALAMGGPRQQWVIPKVLAKTLDNWKRAPDTTIEKFVGAGINAWKQWTLLNPNRVTIYNVNNLSGDLDISLAAAPRIVTYAPKAAFDLWKLIMKKEAPTAEMVNLQKKGVIGSGFVIQEVPEIGKHQFFEILEGRNPSLIERYWRTVKDFTAWRESVLRVSAYRYFLDEIQSGKKPYGASKVAEIDAVRDQLTNQDLAAKLSRELIGDYGNVSVAGQWLRTHMIPFYAWMEINAPRYVRLFKNVRAEGGTGAGPVITGTANLSARASALFLLVNLSNRLFFGKEEEELGDTRGQLHLILGRNEDGTIRSLRFQGALSDALGWFGMENITEDIGQVSEGRASLKDKAIEALKAAPTRIINAASPIQKTGMEALVGRSLYPDPFNPRPVRDRAEHVARLFSMGTVYGYLAGKPRRGIDKDILGLISYTTDPGEAAYYASKEMVSDFLSAIGKERSVTIPSARANALYYYKKARQYGDEALARKWYDKYTALGGTQQGVTTSIRASAPLGGLSLNDKQRLLKEATPKEKEIIRKAEEWYQKIYK